MREIPLTRGMVAIVDVEDFPLVSAYKWRASPDCRTFYAHRGQRTNGRYKLIQMHRMILQPPSGIDVDHINGDGLDNRRSNLRLATGSDNNANRIRLLTNTSGRRGVTWHRQAKRWQAGITRYRKRIHLGLFTDLDAAARAYDTAARALFGEFARPNFPEAPK